MSSQVASFGIGFLQRSGCSFILPDEAMTETHAIDPSELERHIEWVSALARSLVRDPGAAHDLSQDTLVTAIERAPRDVPLAPWLVRVMRNLAIQRFRRDRARPRVERAASRADETETPSLERLEAHRMVVDAVLRLAEPYRGAIVARYFEGRRAVEIADRLGVPPATVRSRVQRGLAMLRDDLDRRSGGRDGWVAVLAPLVDASSAAKVAVGGGVSSLGAWIVMSTFTACLVFAVTQWSPTGDPPPSPSTGVVVTRAVADEPVGIAEEPRATDPSDRVESPVDGSREEVGELRIVGKVVGPDGAPVAGADVVLRWTRIVSNIALENRRRQETTDEEGRFAIAIPETLPASFLLTVTADGLVAHTDRLETTTGRPSWPDLGEIRLLEAARVTGRVVGLDGQPANAGWTLGSTAPFGIVDVGDGARFHIDRLEPGVHELRLRIDGTTLARTYAVEVEAGQELDVGDLALPASPQTSDEEHEIRVVFRPRPQDGFRPPTSAPGPRSGTFEVPGPDVDPARIRAARPDHERLADDDGVVRDLLDAEYTVIIDDPRYETVRRDHVVPGSLYVRLTGSSSIEPRILAADGRPLVGATVAIQRVSEQPQVFIQPRAMRPESGRFDDLVAGAYELVVVAEGYPEHRRRVPDLRPRERREVVIRLERGASLSGTVLDSDGERASGAVVALYPPATDDRQRLDFVVRSPEADASVFSVTTSREPIATVTAPDGRFDFHGVPRGEITVLARSADGMASFVDIDLAGRDELEDVRLVLPERRYIDLLVDVPPAQRTGLVAVARCDDGIRLRQDWTGVTLSSGSGASWTGLGQPISGVGPTRLGPFAAGRVAVAISRSPHVETMTRRGVTQSVSGTGEVLHVAEVELGDQEVVRYRVDESMLGAGSVRLSVVANGRPLGGVDVVVGSARSTTDASGVVELAGVVAGIHSARMESRSEGWIWPVPSVSIAVGERTDVEVEVPRASGRLALVDEDGEPLGFHRLLLTPDGASSRWTPRTLATGSDGIVAMELPPARYELRVEGRAYRVDWTANGPVPETLRVTTE